MCFLNTCSVIFSNWCSCYITGQLNTRRKATLFRICELTDTHNCLVFPREPGDLLTIGQTLFCCLAIHVLRASPSFDLCIFMTICCGGRYPNTPLVCFYFTSSHDRWLFSFLRSFCPHLIKKNNDRQHFYSPTSLFKLVHACSKHSERTMLGKREREKTLRHILDKKSSLFFWSPILIPQTMRILLRKTDFLHFIVYRSSMFLP